MVKNIENLFNLNNMWQKIQPLKYSARQLNFLNILMVKQNITTIKKSKI